VQQSGREVEKIRFLRRLCRISIIRKPRSGQPTSHELLDVVQRQVHELAVALERSSDGMKLDSSSQQPVPWKVTPSATAELDADLLVHVFRQIQDVFLLWLVGLAALSSSSPAATAASVSSPSAAGQFARKAEASQHSAKLASCICAMWFVQTLFSTWKVFLFGFAAILLMPAHLATFFTGSTC
jgi:hypothetical protein